MLFTLKMYNENNIFLTFYTMSEKKQIKEKRSIFKKLFWSAIWKTQISEKPFNIISIILIMAFDVFIFINILDGLDYQRSNIVSTYDKYPSVCSTLFRNEDKELSLTEIDKIKYYNNYKNRTSNYWLAKWVDLGDDRVKFCSDLDKFVFDIKNDEDFIYLSKEINTLSSDIRFQENKQSSYKRSYDEYRDDVVSWLWKYDDRLSDIDDNNVRSNYEKILSEISDLKERKKESLEELNSLDEVISLKTYLNKNRQEFIWEYENYRFWYPVYVTLMEMILIIPIFLLSILGYKFYINRKNKIFTVLFANLAIISGIFTFYIFMKVVYWILPKKLLANIFTYLASLKLLAIWNYILVILWILIFGLFIYLSQKASIKLAKIKEENIKEKERINRVKFRMERYEKGQCIECSAKLLPWAIYCNECWKNQFDECVKCKNLVPKVFNFCEKCWEEK